MSMIINLDDLNEPLVSPSYISSDDRMEFDTISVASLEDSNIQVFLATERSHYFLPAL